ncbi:hypothetical protein Goari_003015 [Gossypium aridum]|uniref:Phytocyanin domain-containing protein n=1 Tax=Gossypium aridum TaxID=34290 RepID=A0A7J8YA49_GOSAI|nr:hypothetical protein [Gossypium aridum]
MAAKRIVAQALLILMPALLRLSLAAVYKVGDSAGWTTIGNIDYKQWAATKTFQVGDVIPGAGFTVFWESNSKQPGS